MQDGNGTTIVYIDFSKAFDVVPHNKLFVRLQSYGVQGNLFLWLCRFFCNRSHHTTVGSSLSNEAELISGIVQGSVVLGHSCFSCI